MPLDTPPAIVTPYTGTIEFHKFDGPTYININSSDGESLVSISMKDGTITYGPHYKPDEAAQVFWRSISSEYAEYLEWKKAHSR